MMRRVGSDNIWLNLLGFQLAWWCAILMTHHSLPILFSLLILHLLFHRQPVIETSVLLLCGLTGFAVDVMLTVIGFFQFEASDFPPFWLLLLWFCFSATLRQSLSFFHSRLLLAAVCGGFFGSLTYLTAAHLGVVTLGFPWLSSGLVLMLIWMLLFPLLIRFSEMSFMRRANHDG
ncbi:DUF2878 domain-containing protein [Amphritea sp. 1_MG-2023]|uniref:DUF2878 domain-containing protein n=1 Tax=Amphritea sp. 1_MG-2023 TaxID=3062670 RepID=UPI0026E117CC|nr:DUF2878 domain-containing protein [Amphritea sp. 1_MG-2023]MDO6563333.1 DUF2878 domain-containing protein [Amphritea sp. 1_MG-2023]